MIMADKKRFRWIFGQRPEFVDPKVVAQSEGREG